MLTVSSLIQYYWGFGGIFGGICLSLPTALDQSGVEWVLPMAINYQETDDMCQSAQSL